MNTPVDSSLPDALDRAITADQEDLVRLRRHLHAHPELSRHETSTSALLAERLEALGYTVRTRPEGTGLLAEIAPDDFDPASHPTVAIRADMDALPIEELNETSYRSTHQGVMHACGHDVHMTCAMGAARALAARRAELGGRVRIVYQHAEEVAPSGAREMVAFGAVEGVDAILALHCDPELPAGQIGVRDGALTAAFDRFEYTVHGQGGHGARPHHCVDPIFVATQLLQALYTLAGRRFDAREPMVVSVGQFQAGYAPNVIPDTALIAGTVRTVSPERRAHVEPTLRALADAIGATHEARIALDLYKGAPAILNHPRVNEHLVEAACAVLGHGAVHTIPLPSMGSEDFSHFLQHVPGAMYRLGTARPGRPVHLLHSARFDVDERAIGYGARILSRAVVGLIGALREDREILKG